MRYVICFYEKVVAGGVKEDGGLFLAKPGDLRAHSQRAAFLAFWRFISFFCNLAPPQLGRLNT